MFWVSKGMEPRRGGIPLAKGVVKAAPAEPSGLASEAPCRPRVYLQPTNLQNGACLIFQQVKKAMRQGMKLNQLHERKAYSALMM